MWYCRICKSVMCSRHAVNHKIEGEDKLEGRARIKLEQLPAEWNGAKCNVCTIIAANPK